jgi:hypothetical protein
MRRRLPLVGCDFACASASDDDDDDAASAASPRAVVALVLAPRDRRARHADRRRSSSRADGRGVAPAVGRAVDVDVVSVLVVRLASKFASTRSTPPLAPLTDVIASATPSSAAAAAAAADDDDATSAPRLARGNSPAAATAARLIATSRARASH